MTSKTANPIYVFGPFTFDPARATLVRGSEEVALPGQVAQLLHLLLAAHGRFVDKETIAAQLWPGAPRQGNNLFQHVYLLRHTLKEHALDRACVVGVRGRGYRIAMPVAVRFTTLDVGVPTAIAQPLSGQRMELLHHYARASHLVERGALVDLMAAVRQYEKLLETERSNIAALVGLARAYVALAHGYMPSEYAFAHARRAVLHALDVDPSCGAAHAVLAAILLFGDWNWDGAEKELDTAIHLDPWRGAIRSISSQLHFCKGSRARGLEDAHAAFSRDPGSVANQLLMARAQLAAGAYDHCIDLLSGLIDEGAAESQAHLYRAQAHMLSGHPARAISDLSQVRGGRSEEIAFRSPMLARAYADCGEERRATEIYEFMRDAAPSEHVMQFNLAIVAAGLQRFGDALDHLEKAVAKREPAIVAIEVLPWFHAIDHLARFKAILAKVRTGDGAPAPRRTVGLLKQRHADAPQASRAPGSGSYATRVN